MTTELWAALIAAVLGGGGLGAAIVNALVFVVDYLAQLIHLRLQISIFLL